MLNLIKEYKMMKAFKIFSMAAVAFMMVACSSEDTALDNTPIAGQKVHFTATIAAPGSDALTRTTYTEITSGTDAGKIKVAWEQGDEIALIHNGKKDVVTVQTLNADGSANISGDITVGTDGEAVTIVYPAASVNAPTSGAEPVEDATYATKWNSQDGTLTYIQDNLDFCRATSTLKVSGTNATLNDNISMGSTIAIFKFTIQDLGGTAKDATEFKVSDASGNVIATVTPVSATGTLYVALPVMAAGTYWFNATIGGKPYINKATTSAATTAGTYYQSKIKMATLGDLMADDGKFYSNGTAITSPTKAIGVIAYLGNDNFTEAVADGGGHGLVLCLKNAASNVCWSTLTSPYVKEFADEELVTDLSGLTRTDNVSGYNNTQRLITKYGDAFATNFPAASAAKNYTTLPAPTTGTTGWFLPSAQQWVKMQEGLGALDESVITWFDWFDDSHTAADKWETALAKAGAGNYDSMTSAYLLYWSSSEQAAGSAVILHVNAPGTDSHFGFLWQGSIKVFLCYVRPVLAF
jgi:hypothetical protein